MGTVVKDGLKAHVFVCNVHKGVMEEPFKTPFLIMRGKISVVTTYPTSFFIIYKDLLT